ncbi:MAG: NAD(P)H-hydrate dehydratase [Clostridia bacterium]|nr:NAD(P)H-hydrate dehydratase [Clostridia bacterium]
MLVYTCEQMRVIEENADVNGLSYVQMMENAGNACADKIYSVISGMGGVAKSVAVICGSGKNGGDGYVIARNLCERGFSVTLILADGFPAAYESKMMYSYLEDKPVIIMDLSGNYLACVNSCLTSSAIVDCVYGIGFHGKLNELISRFFKDISKSRAKKFSVDIPSGLEGNSGEINSDYFKTDYTLAITCYKPVHILKPACEECGIVKLIDIGIGKEAYEAVGSEVIVSAEQNEIKRFFKARRSDAHKGDFGKLLSIAGSMDMQGAAVMAASAAVNSGVGLVRAVFPDMAYAPIASKLTEPLTMAMISTPEGNLSFKNIEKLISLAEESTAVLLGCGMGFCEDTVKIVEAILLNTKKPIILDADGINAVAVNINVLKESKAPLILTPHIGEMSRLTGLTVEEIEKNRVIIAKNFASEYGCILVLKGANTVVAAPTGNVYINRTGNAGMATGGSGDVLAGIIASFVCQSMGLQSATIAGVYVHGMCGDTALKKYSMLGVTPTKMINELAEVLSNFER